MIILMRQKLSSNNNMKMPSLTSLIFGMLDVSGAMPDSYSPTYVEAAWYPWWEKQVNHFLMQQHTEQTKAKAFDMVQFFCWFQFFQTSLQI